MPMLLTIPMQLALVACVAISATFYAFAIWQALSGREPI